MYEDQMKALRWLANMFPYTHPAKSETDKMSNCIHLYCEQGANAIQEAEITIAGLHESIKGLADDMPRWIPVTERLPQDRYDVLVYAGVIFPYITVGYYNGLWKFSFNDEEIDGGADYWMPLPQPPKEE